MLQSRSSVVNWLWTNNPFYFISALLMLYAVRSAYGEIEIGAINSWVMMGVLALYTSVLAVLGVMIVRWGRVWDDARSILLLLLLMFLAVSVSADDLFVRMESSSAAAALLGSGLTFSVLIFQFVLRGARIRLGAAFQIPFLLFLALFYITPWWCSPELHPRKAMSLDWTVFLFPQVAAVLCLTLLPAVRKGKAYVADNGTPWAWPWFPWAAFGCFAGAVLLRSYALTLTFSQSGPIWHSPEIRSGIVLDTIWRPYFIAPAVLAVMLLILEAGLVSGNRRLVRRVMLSTSLLLPMAWPWANTLASAEFLMRVTETVGSPLWLTLWMLVAFHGWALLRRVPEANLGLLGSAILLCVVGPHTNGISTLDLQPVALLMVSAVVALLGLYRRSTAVVLAASGVMTLGLWLILPETILISLRATTCYHALLAVCVALSLSLTDRTARILRSVISAWIPTSALIVALLPESTGIPSSWRLLYIVGLAATCLACAQLARSKPYWSGFVGTTAILGYSLAAVGFRSAGAVVGRNAMAAFSWSIGTLLIGALISAYKAGWLPPLPWLAWIGGRPPQDPLPEIVPADPAGETSE